MKIKRHIVVYAAVIAACYALMPLITTAAYNFRGYFAVGGEWLLPVFIIVFLEAIRTSLPEKNGGKENGSNEKRVAKR